MKSTSELIKVIKKANQLARYNSDGLMGTEQLLAAILATDCEMRREMVGREHLSVEAIRTLPDRIIDMSNRCTDFTIYSDRVNRIFTALEMISTKYDVIADTVLLMFCILNHEDCFAVKILEEAGANVKEMQETIAMMLMMNRVDVDEAERIIKNPENFTAKKSVVKFEYQEGYDEQKNPFKVKQSQTQKQEEDNDMSELEQLGCYDVVEKAKSGKIDPVIGRIDEINNIIISLGRKTKNNPVLIGEPGVGKTAIIEGLALAIAKGKDLPESIKDKRIISVDVTGLVAGSTYRGMFEEKLKSVINYAKDNNDVILFIDEIHMIMGAGETSDSNMDAANILKPYIARGDIKLIGATTLKEYRIIEKDEALSRRFQPITINPPTVDDTKVILEGIKEKYEQHHDVKISEEALNACVELSDRYINERFLPDKAIDVMDTACAEKSALSKVPPVEISEYEDKIKRLNVEKKVALEKEDYKKCEELKKEIEGCQLELHKMKVEWNNRKTNQEIVISVEDITATVSKMSSIPVSKISGDEKKRLMHLEEDLKKRVKGQDEAVKGVASAVKRSRAGIADTNKPVSFLFLGPTGVGKTELAKALAENLFGDENQLIRLDMSEYQNEAMATKLIGSAPGYVGYEEGGQLTEMVRRKPYSVILFDEIEKADARIFDMFLQILDDGRLTDNTGKVVNFKNTIIIMTSNAGSAKLSKKGLGFGSGDTSNADYKKQQLDSLKEYFRPEFINRIGEKIVFNKLDKISLLGIVDKLLSKLYERLKNKNITLECNDEVKEFLCEAGYDEAMGARPLARKIEEYIETPCADLIIQEKIEDGDTIVAEIEKKNEEKVVVFKKNSEVIA